METLPLILILLGLALLLAVSVILNVAAYRRVTDLEARLRTANGRLLDAERRAAAAAAADLSSYNRPGRTLLKGKRKPKPQPATDTASAAPFRPSSDDALAETAAMLMAGSIADSLSPYTPETPSAPSYDSSSSYSDSGSTYSPSSYDSGSSYSSSSFDSGSSSSFGGDGGSF